MSDRRGLVLWKERRARLIEQPVAVQKRHVADLRTRVSATRFEALVTRRSGQAGHSGSGNRLQKRSLLHFRTRFRTPRSPSLHKLSPENVFANVESTVWREKV